MRLKLFAGGIVVMVIATIALIWIQKSNQTDSKEKSSSKVAEDALPKDSPVVRMPDSVAMKEWKVYSIKIEGKQYTFKAREYPEPVLIGDLVSRSAGKKMNRQSPIELLVAQTNINLNCASKESIQELSQLWENPAEQMKEHESLQPSYGGWNEYAAKIRALYEEQRGTKQIVAEISMDRYHVFVVKISQATLFSVMKKSDAGEYKFSEPWGEDIKPLLFDNRVLQVFEKHRE